MSDPTPAGSPPGGPDRTGPEDALSGTIEDASTQWSRLDRRMLLVHPVRELGRFLPVLLFAFLAGSGSGGSWWQFVGVAVPIVLGLLRYLTTTYRVRDGRVELRRGLLNQRVLSVPLDRVRTVDLTSPAVHRLLGLTMLRIGTGSTASGDDLDLDGLALPDARRMRDELLTEAGAGPRADPRADPDPRATAAGTADTAHHASAVQQVVGFEPSWLRFAPLTSSGIVVAAAALAAGLQLLNLRGVAGRLHPDRWTLPLPVTLAVVLGILALLVVVVLLSVLGYLVTNGRFALTRSAGSWQVSRGLLTTRETQIEQDRIAGVVLGEPLALRIAGGRHLAAIVTGVDRSERGSSTLVPPSPAPVAVRTAGVVLGTPRPVEVALVPHGPAATRRRWTRALVPTGVGAALVAVAGALGAPAWLLLACPVLLLAGAGLAHDRVRGLGHAWADGHVVARSGSLTRSREVLDADHVIGWNLRASWWQRRAGLTTLVATTAGGRQQVRILDLTESAAIELAGQALPALVEPFLERPDRI